MRAVGRSLPPHVPGNVQGWLHAELVDLTDSESSGAILGALEWWGDDSTVLVEVRGTGSAGSQWSDAPRSVEFPIRASPKRFMAYLQDMQFLRVHLYCAGTDQAFDSGNIGLCEVGMLPYLRGPDADYQLHLDGYFPVMRSNSDRMTIGRLRLSLCTEWAEHAELRPKQAVGFKGFEMFWGFLYVYLMPWIASITWVTIFFGASH